jgi:SAM-dependent methyltransferase
MQKASLTSEIRCILCRSSATPSKYLDRDEMANSLERALATTGARKVLPKQSDMYRCINCALEFSVPMQEPGHLFYEWLTTSNFPYPMQRWEWLTCKNLIEQEQANGSKIRVLLDVGCGDGAFLASLSNLSNLRALGVDFNKDAVNTARSLGLEAVVGGLKEVREFVPAGVDIITLWHVVEHVADPIGLLQIAKDTLYEEGTIYFSVPLSPMSYESVQFDPFNLPPHHLSRWNIQSLQALANSLNMDFEFELPSAESLTHRVVRSLSFQAISPFQIQTRWKKAFKLTAFLATRPWRLLLEILHQRRHPKYGGKVLPDAIFVKLEKRKKSAGRNI